MADNPDIYTWGCVCDHYTIETPYPHKQSEDIKVPLLDKYSVLRCLAEHVIDSYFIHRKMFFVENLQEDKKDKNKKIMYTLRNSTITSSTHFHS